MGKTARLLFSLWMVFAYTVGSPTPCMASALVSLRQDAEIDRAAVRLSDLFEGVPSDIDRDIAQAPQLCKSAVYDERVLNKLADTYRLDWQSRDNDHVVITSACVRVTEAEIKDALAEKARNEGGIKKQKFDIALNTRNLEINLPADQKSGFDIRDFYYDATSKQFRANLRAETERGPYIVPLAGRILVKRSAPVLTRRMEAGSSISAADLDWIDIPEEKMTSDIVTEADQLIGRELRRDAAEGNMIRAHDIIPQRLVLRGSLVTMKIQTPYITLIAQGKAQQDGAKGDTVKVMNTQSNRLVEGVVTEFGTVEIVTARQMASVE